MVFLQNGSQTYHWQEHEAMTVKLIPSWGQPWLTQSTILYEWVQSHSRILIYWLWNPSRRQDTILKVRHICQSLVQEHPVLWRCTLKVTNINGACFSFSQNHNRSLPSLYNSIVDLCILQFNSMSSPGHDGNLDYSLKQWSFTFPFPEPHARKNPVMR